MHLPRGGLHTRPSLSRLPPRLERPAWYEVGSVESVVRDNVVQVSKPPRKTPIMKCTTHQMAGGMRSDTFTTSGISVSKETWHEHNSFTIHLLPWYASAPYWPTTSHPSSQFKLTRLMQSRREKPEDLTQRIMTFPPWIPRNPPRAVNTRHLTLAAAAPLRHLVDILFFSRFFFQLEYQEVIYGGGGGGMRRTIMAKVCDCCMDFRSSLAAYLGLPGKCRGLLCLQLAGILSMSQRADATCQSACGIVFAEVHMSKRYFVAVLGRLL